MLPLWECPECGRSTRAEPTAGDDWDGEDAAVGPMCLDCEETMELVEEPPP